MSDMYQDEDEATPLEKIVALTCIVFDPGRRGVLFLIDRAEPALLGPLSRALLPHFPGLNVVADPESLFNSAPGSPLIYVPDASHATALNLRRPVFSNRQLRVIVFSDQATTLALSQRAPDFFDWVGHRRVCPSQPLRFVERGLRLSARYNGLRVSYHGPAPHPLLKSIFPKREIIDQSPALPERMLRQKLSETRKAILVCADVNDEERLMKLERAMEESRRMGSLVLWNPRPETLRFWAVQAEPMSAVDGIEELTRAGMKRPGLMHALLDGETEAVLLLAKIFRSGKLMEEELVQGCLSADDPGVYIAKRAEASEVWPDGNRPSFDLQSPPLLRAKAQDRRFWSGEGQKASLARTLLRDRLRHPIQRIIAQTKAAQMEIPVLSEAAQTLYLYLQHQRHIKQAPIAWLGAGASAASGYPTLLEVEEKLRGDLPECEGKGFDLIDEYIEKRGEGGLIQAIERHFGQPRGYGEIHRAMVDLLGLEALEAVFTTNADSLIDEALRASGVPEGRLLRLLSGEADVRRALLQGLNPRVYEQYSSVLKSKLERELSGRPWLFAGCSMQDERLLSWLRDLGEQARESLPGGRILISERDWKAVGKRGQRLLESANIKPILVEGHAFVPKVLKEAVEELKKPRAARAEAEKSQAGELEALDEAKGYLYRYRTVLSGRFERFEMVGTGMVQPGGAASPVGAKLEEMYVPLRWAEEIGKENSETGREIGAEDLLAKHTRLILCGMAGAGKTTWIKYTFRKLLWTEKALPLFVELRHLASVWHRYKNQAKAFSLMEYLLHTLEESQVPLEKSLLEKVLRSPDVRPLLLIDGWDELGEMGETFREGLMAFVQNYPRVNVAATSRPYGQSRPAQAEEFRSLQAQPLSDAEIGRLSERFYAKVYGQDQQASKRGREQFERALLASAQAQSLARTPLLLVMMLLISRDRPLPDKRHRLYQICMENLLTARPDQKSQEGARLHIEQWRPEDGAERLRAASELAFKMQTAGYAKEGEQRAIVIGWADAEDLLPKTWQPLQRRGFLAWLVGAAGVMNDRTDGELSFAHLSFQEYLCAFYWASRMEGDEARIELCQQHAGRMHWWETLRLWAALVHDESPEKAGPVFRAMLQGKPEAFWLLGAMLADGTGDDKIFDAWVEELGNRFHVLERDSFEPVAQAWSVCKQEQRRKRMEQAWPGLQKRWSYIQCLTAREWGEAAKLEIASQNNDAFEILCREAGEGQGMGRGRVLSGFNPLWPCQPLIPILLRLWPTPRRDISTRLSYLFLGTQASFQEQHIHVGLLRMPVVDEDLARIWARDLARDLARVWARDLASVLASVLARVWARDLARVWARDWASVLARDLASVWGLDENDPSIADIATLDIGSFFGRATTRVALAYQGPEHLNSPLLQLFHHACLLSLHPKSDPARLEAALRSLPPGEDPLWPALARWITRRAQPGDRELLESLAQNPELRKDNDALYYGLKYYVRGDIVLPDNSERTLDDYCDMLKVPRLPYLEEMTDEIELEEE